MPLPHGWITPEGDVRHVQMDHKEVSKGRRWGDMFEEGWLRIGEAFGTSFVHGKAEAIFYHRNVIAMMLEPSEKVRLQFHETFYGIEGDYLTFEELLDADTPEDLRRSRFISHGTVALRRRPKVRRHYRAAS